MKRKLKDYTDVLFSNRNLVVIATVYDTTKGEDVLSNIVIEEAIEKYGEREVDRMYPDKGVQIIEIK